MVHSSTALPVELFELFINAIWCSSLSKEDRINFMVASSLVNKTWSELFHRISSTDVHIVTRAFGKKYFPKLEGPEADKYEQERWWMRSVTVILDYGSGPRQSGAPYRSPGMSLAVSLLLRVLNRGGRARFPNLQRLNVGHKNPPFDADIFDLLIWNPFPSIISELELTYDHSENTPVDVIEKRQANYGRWHKSLKTQFDSIKVLSFRGAPRELIDDFGYMCPNLETLILELTEPMGGGIKYCHFDLKTPPPGVEGEQEIPCGTWSITAIREGQDLVRVYAGDRPHKQFQSI